MNTKKYLCLVGIALWATTAVVLLVGCNKSATATKDFAAAASVAVVEDSANAVTENTKDAVVIAVSTVTINGKTWTRQNLNIDVPDSYCYRRDPVLCAKYGRLYTWEAAKSACRSMGGKWRLPTNDDWDNLMEAAGGVRDIHEYEMDEKPDTLWNELMEELELTGQTWDVKVQDVEERRDTVYTVYIGAGKKLKSKSGWGRNYDYWSNRRDSSATDEFQVLWLGDNALDGSGTDDYGFEALPGGFFSGHSTCDCRRISTGHLVGVVGFWWSATEDGNDRAYYRSMGNDEDYVAEHSSKKNAGYSVRCVKN